MSLIKKVTVGSTTYDIGASGENITYSASTTHTSGSVSEALSKAGGSFIDFSLGTDYANKTVTLSVEDSTYNIILSSTGSGTISGVNEIGDAIITCEENHYELNIPCYSKYTISSLAITINVTVYSAANDTVYYYEGNDTSTSAITLCTTDSDGKAESVELSVIPSSTIIFYSTVAKDPNNTSNPYSKAITLVRDITELYVMPDGFVVYWYGYGKSNLKNLSSSDGWSYDTSVYSSATFTSANTFNTNNICISPATPSAGVSIISGVYVPSTISLANYNTANIMTLCQKGSASSTAIFTNGNTSKVITQTNTSYCAYSLASDGTVLAYATADISSVSDDVWFSCNTINGRISYLYAAWYE